MVPRLLVLGLALFSCGTGAVLAAMPAIKVAPERPVPGTALRITISGVGADARLRGTALETELVFLRGADGIWAAFAGVDLETPPGVYTFRVHGEWDGGATLEHAGEITVVAKDYPTEQLKVAAKYVEPPPEVAARIARESAALKELWARATPERVYDGATLRPLAGVPGRNFGRRRVFNGKPRSPHSGADLAAPVGTEVPAAARGRVALARELYFSGNLVVLDHGGGVYTLYAHLSRMNVSEGAMVAAGDIIGRVGATGRVTGPHLHWGARIGEARVDPGPLLELLAGDR